MRDSTLLRKIIGVTGLVVRGTEVRREGLVVDVVPSRRRPRCGRCGKRAPGYDRLQGREWRHLPFGSMVVRLRYAPRRVACRACGVTEEEVPWAEHRSRFTRTLEEMVAYLAQIADHTAVTRLMAISWRAVASIVRRVVKRNLDPRRLDGLRDIAIDEISYRKRHKYVTLVADQAGRRVVWATPGHDAAALRAFFKELGPERTAQLETVTMDMASAYIKVVREMAPQARIVFDRFHVQRLASDAVDEVRREQMRSSTDPEQARAIKHSRYALLRNPWDLNQIEQLKLQEIEKHNKPLYRAYLLKEGLAKALDYAQPSRAQRALDRWLSWASRSRLSPFLKAARTIRKHKPDILAYVQCRLTNGFLEGLNNKVRVVARRAYGFHSAAALIAMVFVSVRGSPSRQPRLSRAPFHDGVPDRGRAEKWSEAGVIR